MILKRYILQNFITLLGSNDHVSLLGGESERSEVEETKVMQGAAR